MHTYEHASLSIYMCIYICINVFPYIHTYVYVDVHIYICVRVYTCIYMCTHTYTHKQSTHPTYVRTYVHTHTQVHAWLLLLDCIRQECTWSAQLEVEQSTIPLSFVVFVGIEGNLWKVLYGTLGLRGPRLNLAAFYWPQRQAAGPSSSILGGDVRACCFGGLKGLQSQFRYCPIV